jgi:hypothetical protein
MSAKLLISLALNDILLGADKFIYNRSPFLIIWIQLRLKNLQSRIINIVID